MAQVRGDALVQHRRIDRAEHARLFRAPQTSGIDRDEDVGGAELALGLDPLDQRIGIGLDAVDLDPSLLGEVLVEREIGVVVARGIEVDLARIGRRFAFAGGFAAGSKAGAGGKSKEQFLHGRGNPVASCE